MKQIPLEVKARIAAQLDLPSARNLTVSCKAWRNAGEMAVWNEVDLTTGWYGELLTYSISAPADPSR